MKKYTMWALVILFVVGFTVDQANATLSYDLTYVFNGDTPAVPGPWLKAEFNTVSTGVVTLKLTSNFAAPNSDYYFKQVAFNVDTAIKPDDLSISIDGTKKYGTYTDPSISKSTQNDQTLHGSGNEKFDVLLDFSDSNANRFNLNDSVTLKISKNGITENSFNFLSSTGTANVGAHIGGWSVGRDDQSGAISNVPIPGAVWLLASGLIGLVGVRRRFHK
jgi:hypothetical protein